MRNLYCRYVLDAAALGLPIITTRLLEDDAFYRDVTARLGRA